MIISDDAEESDVETEIQDDQPHKKRSHRLRKQRDGKI